MSIKEIAEQIIAKTKKLALGQKRVGQNEIADPNNKYACLFTCYYMLANQFFLKSISMPEYKHKCVSAGAMREDFYVLDHNKMLSSVGIEGTMKKISTNMQKAIYESLLRGRPVIASLSGKHWESIDGWEVVNDTLCFTVDDPGYQKDTYCDTSTLEVFRVENNKRVYSKHADGSRRAVTSVMVVA
jgi:hypothetical protein